MARGTMTINTRFSLQVEPFCGEDSPTAFSNEKKKKRKRKILFSERRRLIESKIVPMDTGEKKKYFKKVNIQVINHWNIKGQIFNKLISYVSTPPSPKHFC